MGIVKLFWLVLLVPLVGCATIVSDEPGRVSISSDPPNAEFKIVNDNTGQNVAVGTAPQTVMLRKSNGYFKPAHYTVKCNKSGFAETQIPLKSTIDGWYLGGNLLVGGLVGWLIVDPATGAMWNLNEPNILCTLPPAQRISHTPASIETDRILEKGVTPMERVRLKLGEPTETQFPASGYKYWAYYYSSVPQKLILQFTKDGILNDYVNEDI